MARNGYVRMNIEVHEDVIALLSRLESELKVSSKTAVLQKAVQLLSYVASKKLYVEKEDGSLQELILI